tara:strand:+ start:102 stop:1388 length:1287 start_codon:yes stop_codon:yes gene_type:complete
MATKLLIELGGGEPSTAITIGAKPGKAEEISFRPQRVADLGGLVVSAAECRGILQRLGFACEGGEKLFQVIPPTWRHDIDGEADLVEEILRIKGYQSIPPVSLDRNGLPRPALSLVQRRIRSAGRVLAARGLNECVTWSFVSQVQAEKFGGGQAELKLSNPITEDLGNLRPSLLPNLLSAVSRNTAKGHANLGLFEVGPRFLGDLEADQQIVAGLVRSAEISGRHWLAKPRDADVFDIKADCFALLEYFGFSMERVSLSTDTPIWYHPGRSGQIKLGPQRVLATFGEVHPGILSDFGIEARVVGAEVILTNLPAPKSRKSRARPVLSAVDLPAVERDFAFLVGAEVPVGDLLQAVRSLSGKDSTRSIFSSVNLFDVYSGRGIASGSKSVALGVTISPKEETLTEKEIRRISDSIIAKVEKVTGGKLRK